MSFSNPYRPPSVADSFAPGTPDPPRGSALTPGVMDAMRQTKPWVTFLSILGFAGASVLLLAAIVMIVVGVAEVRVNLVRGFTAFGLGAAYIVLVPTYLVPSLHLFRYGRDITRFLGGDGVPALEDALRSQKTFWKALGSFVLVTLVLYLVGIGALVALGLTQAALFEKS